MSTFKIYLSGGMKNLTYEEQMIHRVFITEELQKGNDIYKCKLDIFNPVEYFNYQTTTHKSEKQIFLFELDRVRKSDLVIVDFNDPGSLGTMSEITVAYEHKVPIIGLNSKNSNLHPWHNELCDVVFDNIFELIEYVKGYYLF